MYPYLHRRATLTKLIAIASAIADAAVLWCMLTTIHLSATESLNYAALRASLRTAARKLAAARGSRFVQLVLADGRIADILEIK